MRQLCNVSYAVQAEWLDKDELAKFDADLVRPPAASGQPQLPGGGQTTGMHELMGLMTGMG